MASFKILRSAVCALACFAVLRPALASPYAIPDDPDRELLSESVPTAFEVAPFTEGDFQLRWEGSAPEGVRIALVPASLTWVRVSRFLVLPRARVRVEAAGADSIEIRSGGSLQSVASSGGDAPISLFSGGHELSIRRGGRISRHRFSHIFTPGPGAASSSGASRVFVDVSCSPHRLVVDSEQLAAGQWAYVGCRMIRSRSGGSDVPQLELHLAWSGTSGAVSVSGIPREASPGSRSTVLTALLTPGNPVARFEEVGGGRFDLSAALPAELKNGFLGAGIGPYSYSLTVPGMESVNQVAPILTLYGSHSVADGSRFVFFDAFPIHRRTYNDFGLYFHNESTRALDERLVFSILLGFHLVSFSSPIGTQHRLGAPQGVEVVWRDALGRRNNASVGGFFYPPINGKTYYNSWLRIGGPSVFGEINYLYWTELSGDGGHASSRSLGISIGAPLFFL